MSIEYIAENLLTSTELLVEKAMENLKIDQTIVATIESQDEGDSNKYYVSTGSTKFYAYSDSEIKYSANQQVYVLVPQGDYTQRKIILNTVPINPLEKTHTSSNRLVNYISVVQPITDYTVNSQIVNDVNDIPYTAITLWSEQTKPLGIRNFDYIAVTITPAVDYEGDNDFSLFISLSEDDTIVITANDLRGNINYLSPEINYEFIFPIPELLSQTTEIGICLAQSTKPMSLKISMSIGYSKSNNLINSNQIILHNNNNNEFSYKLDSNNNVQTEVQIQPEIFDNEHNLVATKYMPSNFITDIKVFRYNIGTSNELAGINWEAIGSRKYGEENASNATWIDDNGIINFNDANKFFTNIETTKFKIYCTIDDNTHTPFGMWSDIIEFNNLNVDKNTAIATGQKIQLKLKDGDSGIYNYYGLDNTFKSSASQSGYTVQVLDAAGDSLMLNDVTYKDTVKSIRWNYPLKLTGIQVATYTTGEKDEANKPIQYVKGILDKVPFSNTVLPTNDWGDTFYYNLKQTCYPNWTHNKIKCTVTFSDNTVETAEINLEFGGFKNRNTPYSLNLDIDNADRYLCENQIIKLKTLFERVDGETSDPPTEGWVWQWVNDSPMIFCDETGNVLSSPDPKYNNGKYYISTADEEMYIKLGATTGYNYYAGVIKLTIPKVQINDVSAQDIVAYLPIPYCHLITNTSGYYFQGPSRIVYDGLNDVSYDNSDIMLYQLNNNLETIAIDMNPPLLVVPPKNNSKPELINVEGVPQGVYEKDMEDTNPRNKGYHTLCFSDKEKSAHKTKLVPVIGNIINSTEFVNIILIKEKNTEDLNAAATLWEQPIITYRNLWANESMYGWDGATTQSGETGVYSPFMAAGTLNNNLFTGVMMGKTSLSNSGDALYGLFGLQKGNPRFKLTEHGEFYVGNGEQFIKLDKGGNFYLTVKNFDLTVGNSYIKLNNNGELDINITKNFKLSAPHLVIDSNEQFIKIYGDADNANLKVLLGKLGSSSYGLNIYDGAVNIYKDSSTRVIYFDSAGNLNMTGTINANNGTIGGFNITPDRFYSDNNKINFYPKKTGTDTIAQFGQITINGYGNVLVRRLLRFYDINSNIGIYVSQIKSSGLAAMCIGSTKFSGADILDDDNQLSIDANPGIVIGGLNNSNSSQINLYSSQGVRYWGPDGGYLRAVLPTATTNWPTWTSYTIGTNNIYYLRAAANGAGGHTYGYIETSSSAWSGARGIALFDSDARMKKNIANSTVTALETIRKIPHRQFNWRSTDLFEPVGYIAQEIEEFLPNSVLTLRKGTEDEHKQLIEWTFLPYITKAIQELDEEIMALKKRDKGVKTK